jgi:hypothetical protein
VGYVYTDWGARSLSAVEADVNAYYSWYGVNGIFFDQASTNCAYSSDYPPSMPLSRSRAVPPGQFSTRDTEGRHSPHLRGL